MLRGTLLSAGSWLLLLGLASASFPDARDEAVKKELKALEGTWQLHEIQEGEFFLDLPANGSTLVLSGSSYRDVNKNGDRKTEMGTFVFDPGKSPRAIDFTPKGGKKKLGIYEIKGDQLRIAVAESGKDRPGDLTATKTQVFTYKRAKP